MENIENTQPLEELREQAAILKNKLDKENIVNEEILRNAMRHKARTINNNAWISVAASAFVILMAFTYFPQLGLSLWFSVGTIVIMLVCDFFTWQYHKNMNQKTLSSDLLTVAKTAKKLKKNYHNWLKYGISLFFVWFVWYSIEMGIHSKSWKEALLTILLLAVGGIIGGLIGFRMHRKVIDTCDEIIRQIEE